MIALIQEEAGIPPHFGYLIGSQAGSCGGAVVGDGFKPSKKDRSGFGPCAYCDRPMQHPASGTRLALTRDHSIPQAMGGRYTLRCCWMCNQLKGSLHPLDWAWFCAAHPRYWKSFETHSEVVRTVVAERSRRVRAGEAPLSRTLMGSPSHNSVTFSRFI